VGSQFLVLQSSGEFPRFPRPSYVNVNRTCVRNVTFEELSDISSVKLIAPMAIAWLPWQPQCALVKGVEEKARCSQKRIWVCL
jgi:hypothetical protein